jgi:hypothetical protein
MSLIGSASAASTQSLEDEAILKQQQRLVRMANNLSWYPLIFVVAWLANTVIRVIQAVEPSTADSYTLAYIHVLCDGTFYQSVGNVLAYGFNAPVKREWRELYVKMISERSIMPLFSFESSGDTDRADDFAMRNTDSEAL